MTTDKPIKLVIGNKSDLENKKVSEEDIKNFTTKSIQYVYTSIRLPSSSSCTSLS